MLQCTNWNNSHERISHITSCLGVLFFQHPLSVSESWMGPFSSEDGKSKTIQNGLCCSRCCIQCSNHIREIRNHFLFVSISSFFFHFLVSIFTGIVVAMLAMYECIFSHECMANECLYQLKPNSKCVVLSNGWMNVFNCVKWAFSLFPSSCHLKGEWMIAEEEVKKKKTNLRFSIQLKIPCLNVDRL